MSGERGESPVFRLRVPAPLLEEAEAKAQREGISLADKVRDMLARWVKRK